MVSNEHCLVVGALNVDLLGHVDRFGQRDEAVELSHWMVAPGGHAGNCATGLTRLEARVRLVASIGNDPMGSFALNTIKETGIDTAFVERTAKAPTGIVFIPVLPDGDKTFYVARGANELLSPLSVERAAEGCDAIIIFDPPYTLFPQIAALARSRLGLFAPGGLVSAAPIETLAPLLHAVQFLIVNHPESQVLSGRMLPHEAALFLSRTWDLHTVVTIGAQGCWIADPSGKTTHCASFVVGVVDATGAGDAFIAGFAAALLRGVHPHDAVRDGCAAGALATRALGARSALPVRSEVDDLLREGGRVVPEVAHASTEVNVVQHLASGSGTLPSLARGADGWRGIIGEGFSLETVSNLIEAIGVELLVQVGDGPVLVAHDGRHQSAAAAHQASMLLSVAGLQVVNEGTLPTPVATFAVHKQRFAAAILITASHNPFYWNGVKLKIAPGMPPDRGLESAIERRRAQPSAPRYAPAEYQRAASEALCQDFVAVMLQQVDVDGIRRAGLRVAVDGLHGIAGSLLGQLLESAGCNVIIIGADMDPFFGGLVPDPMHAASRRRLAEAVRRERADFGFLVDGDGDRLGVLDLHGTFVWPHDILALLVQHAQMLDLRLGAVATTVATGSIVRRVAHAMGHTTVETAVGFKHIAPLLHRQEVMIGGGGVGDIGFGIDSYDRNPFLAALLLLQIVARRQQPVHTVIEQLHETYGTAVFCEMTLQVVKPAGISMESLALEAIHAAGLANFVTDVSRVDGVKVYMGDTTWLLVRAASTEKGLRVYMEMATLEQVTALKTALVQLCREEQ